MRIGRRGRLAISVSVLGLALVLLIVLIMYKWVFVVRNVVVSGEITAPHEEVVRASKIGFGTSIRDVDEEEVRRNVEGSGQYALTGVSYEYPNTVVLGIRERTKDVFTLSGGYVLVMDSDGYVVQVEKTVPEVGAVYVTGLGFSSYALGARVRTEEARLAAVKAAILAIHSQDAQQYVSELNVSDYEQMHILTRTGIDVYLGDAENVENKIAWMKSAVADLESRGQTSGKLDVSSGDKADYSAE